MEQQSGEAAERDGRQRCMERESDGASSSGRRITSAKLRHGKTEVKSLHHFFCFSPHFFHRNETSRQKTAIVCPYTHLPSAVRHLHPSPCRSAIEG